MSEIRSSVPAGKTSSRRKPRRKKKAIVTNHSERWLVAASQIASAGSAIRKFVDQRPLDEQYKNPMPDHQSHWTSAFLKSLEEASKEGENLPVMLSYGEFRFSSRDRLEKFLTPEQVKERSVRRDRAKKA